MTPADAFRYTVLGLGGSVGAATTAVLVLYFVSWRRSPKGRGLLPFHVWTIALSHLGMVSVAEWAVLDAIKTDRAPEGFTLGFAIMSIISIGSLVTIAMKQWDAIEHAPPRAPRHRRSRR